MGIYFDPERQPSLFCLENKSQFKKMIFIYLPGTMVKFDCDPDYVLVGERRRWCYESGDWNWAENGEALCIREL